MTCQGKRAEKVREALGLDDAGSHEANRDGRMSSRKVFVVYGHDLDARTQLEAMLRRWGLEPLIMDQLASEGATVIEKLEKYASDDVSFAVVLATPDDEGYPKGKPNEARPRARQNVVLELGMLLSKLGRERVAILLRHQTAIERPSDIHGLVYIPFEDSVEDARIQLAKEFAKRGINIGVESL
ncbi:MAG TPA: TIR domain-containing protein [Actinomycetota bacterium]|nr:TIR domain-containing protein [Actinomycetota bacterium]